MHYGAETWKRALFAEFFVSPARLNVTGIAARTRESDGELLHGCLLWIWIFSSFFVLCVCVYVCVCVCVACHAVWGFFFFFFLYFDHFSLFFVWCDRPCAPNEKWHRKEHIIIIIILHADAVGPSFLFLLLLVLLLITQCIRSPDVTPSGWLGSKHQLTNSVLVLYKV